jgi:branched-chain amino acid transport system substrate-binding protein
MKAFVEAYRREYGADPDAFAVAEYDAVSMLAAAIAESVKAGAVTGESVRERLATMRYRGLAAEYRSDGKGNMVHTAMIVCYDGQSHVPPIKERYSVQ